MANQSAVDETDLLAGQAQRGCVKAFDELVTRLTPVLVRFFRQRGAGDETEDLAQKAWLRVVRNLSRYDRSRPFRTWVFAIAYRLWIDELRSRASVPAFSPLGDLGDDGHVGTVETERVAQLGECMEQLSAKDREIIFLRYWEKLPLDVVAGRLNLGYGSAKGKAYRAIERLRRCLESREITRF